MKLVGIVLFSGIILAQLVSGQENPESVVVSGNEEDGQILKFRDCKADNDCESVDDELAKLNVISGVKAEESYRCGVFYAGPLGEKPIKALYVVPKRFKFDCNRDESVLIKDAIEQCIELFENLGKAVTWETTSRLRRGGFNFGDDICHHLKHRSGIKRLPPSKRFKEGIPIGYYANFCGNAKWHDTEKRSEDKVCCNVKDPWKYFDCKTGKRTN